MNCSFNSLNVNDTFVFGAYAPVNEGSVTLPISWRVLKKEDSRMLVLAEKVLDMRPFHSESEPVRWEDSELRRWLNEEFFNAAFSTEEKELICIPEAMEDPAGELLWKLFGMETATSAIQDRVFLLSFADIAEHFPGEDNLFCPGAEAEPDVNVEKMGVEAMELCWWLRSSMGNYSMAHIVSPVASIGMSGIAADNPQGVRPAMWLKLGE